ncbi:Putative mechanosensitive ion channel [Helicobacter heilmannii]|uniref:Putative mechanosensitive ion channel n=1 Tax=Helicobacter heilmannii TaxID=35817 RepID=A0A0K2Y4G9_HELHE|nr:Putative mechanosensitive ion channel [Helicobacter heilmannii ASB1.4]CRF47129.1 Putative mechanosensitive ion channel [Helicobacter heilmannii]CRF49566.1 Putative mechanosensitive ion channel [Helicobacter heilmannii]CRF50736.1 Putative mechanosensitive ion channel [Helicobacter heilmannii]CRI34021.1 Putative mechanosensitive ion channel [Helicobacter heilmannii]
MLDYVFSLLYGGCVFRVLWVLWTCVGLILAQESTQIQRLQEQATHLEHKIRTSDNIWLKKFSNFESYEQIYEEIQAIQRQIKTLKNKKNSDTLKISTLNHTLKALKYQEELLEEYKMNPFKELVEKPNIANIPSITNPIAIVTGISFIKQIKAKYTTMKHHKKSLHEVLDLINQELEVLTQLEKLQRESGQEEEHLAKKIYQEQVKKIELQGAQNLLKTSMDVYLKDIDEVESNIKSQIKDQIFKLIYVALIALVSIFLAWVLKVISHKYIHSNERAYTINKAINFVNANVVVLIFLFAYLENVSYLVTVLGFASAGIAIAMRDLFMSVLGWFMILIEGNIHVGDRVKVTKDGHAYVGDVLDISALYTTILEDVTLTSYKNNECRAGRIIFVPNNYIFSNLLCNYSHFGMKTVWDGIVFCVTFDSNYKKAMQIALDIANTQAKQYTEMTYKQMNNMRTKYSLRNTSANPRVFMVLEQEGIHISVWYQTNSYATLALKSKISSDIIEALLKEPDIFIAYSTTKFVQSAGDGFGNKNSVFESKELRL